MNHSRTFAAALSGLTLLAVGALAQQGSGNSGSNSTTPATSQRPATATTPATTSADPMNSTTPSSTTPASSTNTTTSGSMNSDKANANADLSATAGFYGPGASQFKNIDTDADGRISRAEFTASASASVDLSLDANKDGIVSIEERNAGSTATGEKKHWWSKRSDSAGADLDPAATFEKLDADHDGFLSQNELASANAKLKK